MLAPWPTRPSPPGAGGRPLPARPTFSVRHPTRVQRNRAAGGRVGALSWTRGAYDIVSAAESPDEDAARATLLALGALGNVRTESLRAFDADDRRRILATLGSG